MKNWLKIFNLIFVFVYVLGAIVNPSKENIKNTENLVTSTPVPSVEGVFVSKYKVTRVIDGDTLEIENKIKIRLIGIDAPEAKNEECYQQESTNYLKSLIENQQIELEKDISETDRYGRLLRYIYKDGIMINELLVSEGYALASSYPPDIKYQLKFKEAEKFARLNMKGLWNSCNLLGK